MAGNSNTESLPADTINTTSAIMTPYNLFYTTSRMNVALHQGDSKSPVIFYAQAKLLKARPGFIIRRGSDKGIAISFVQIPWTMLKTMHIGLGDGLDDPETEELTRRKHFIHRSDYDFSFDDVEYTWVKDKSKSWGTAYQCVDEAGKAYASMLSGGAFNWKKAGEMELRNGISDELQAILLAGAIGIWTAEALAYGSLVAAY